MPEYLTQKQLDSTRKQALALRDRLLFEVFYQTGCTVSEIIEIKGKDVSTSQIRIQGRSCHISSELSWQLQEFFSSHSSEYLFATRQSPQLTPRRVQQLIKHVLKPVGLASATPQTIRYTHIVHAAKKGVSFDHIQQQTSLSHARLAEILATHLTQTPTPKFSQPLPQLILETGLTTTQITQLRHSHISQLHISSVLKKQLEAKQMPSSQFVFATRQSPALSVRRIQQILKKAGTSWHALRSQHIIRCLKTESIEQIATRLDLSTQQAAANIAPLVCGDKTYKEVIL